MIDHNFLFGEWVPKKEVTINPTDPCRELAIQCVRAQHQRRIHHSQGGENNHNNQEGNWNSPVVLPSAVRRCVVAKDEAALGLARWVQAPRVGSEEGIPGFLPLQAAGDLALVQTLSARPMVCLFHV